jgi:hypothetical protein
MAFPFTRDESTDLCIADASGATWRLLTAARESVHERGRSNRRRLRHHNDKLVAVSGQGLPRALRRLPRSVYPVVTGARAGGARRWCQRFLGRQYNDVPQVVLPQVVPAFSWKAVQRRPGLPATERTGGHRADERRWCQRFLGRPAGGASVFLEGPQVVPQVVPAGGASVFLEGPQVVPAGGARRWCQRFLGRQCNDVRDCLQPSAPAGGARRWCQRFLGRQYNDGIACNRADWWPSRRRTPRWAAESRICRQ